MNLDFDYSTLQKIIEIAEKEDVKISELVIRQQAKQLEITVDEVFLKMKENFKVMSESIEPGCDKNLRSSSGLTGGSAYKMREKSKSGKSLSGSFLSGALYRALAISELNAAMGKIVASPTAGSCGILPAAILTMQEEKNINDNDCIMSLFTASAVGMVIANNACLAGAQGGCQAECGSASAMAAASIVELAGGTPKMISDAVAIALKNILGLVCDPVAGLVEIPCIKRNASGVAGAIVAAELALAGIESAIPADEVILAMNKVGNSMPSSLRETAEGGLADTPTGHKLREQVFGSKKNNINCNMCNGCSK